MRLWNRQKNLNLGLLVKENYVNIDVRMCACVCSVQSKVLHTPFLILLEPVRYNNSWSFCQTVESLASLVCHIARTHSGKISMLALTTASPPGHSNPSA